MLINQIIAKLCQRHIPHQILAKPPEASLDDGWLAKAIPGESLTTLSILQDNSGYVLAIYPASYQINLKKINSMLHRILGFVDTAQLRQMIQALFASDHADNQQLTDNLHILIDENVTNLDQLCFALPQHRFLRVKSEHLEQLPYRILLGSIFAAPRLNNQPQNRQSAMKELNIREQVEKITILPAMPETARQLLAISNSPNPTLQQLNKAVQQDPALAALVIRYANSALFGMRGQINDLNDAIFRVLGFDGTLYLALGMSLGKRFKLAEKGLLSRTNYWQRSLYTATLAQKLALVIPKNHRPHPGLAYLAGLLHDIGYLILAEQFEKAYQWLNTSATANSDVPISTMEQLFLGVHHSELGSLLANNWNLPDSVCLAIRHHHDSSYTGKAHEYANLVLLCDRLLKPHELSYADNEEFPQELCERLKLDEEQIYLVMDEVIQGDETLRKMATNMSV